ARAAADVDERSARSPVAPAGGLDARGARRRAARIARKEAARAGRTALAERIARRIAADSGDAESARAVDVRSTRGTVGVLQQTRARNVASRPGRARPRIFGAHHRRAQPRPAGARLARTAARARDAADMVDACSARAIRSRVT